MTQFNTPPDQMRVFYDGQCPVCTREIRFYRRRQGAREICWIDVASADDDQLPPGLTRTQALARFHVQNRTGDLLSGGTAFAALWSSLPAFRWAGSLLQTRFLSGPLEMLYRLSLPCRSLLQRCLPAVNNPSEGGVKTGQRQ